MQDATVPPGAQALLNPRGHVVDAEPMVQLPARLPPLAYFDDNATDSPLISDAHRGFVEPFHAEVLPECTGIVEQANVAKLLPPSRVVRPGVQVHGLVGTTMHRAVALFIADKPLPRHCVGALDGCAPRNSIKWSEPSATGCRMR